MVNDLAIRTSWIISKSSKRFLFKEYLIYILINHKRSSSKKSRIKLIHKTVNKFNKNKGFLNRQFK